MDYMLNPNFIMIVVIAVIFLGGLTASVDDKSRYMTICRLCGWYPLTSLPPLNPFTCPRCHARRSLVRVKRDSYQAVQLLRADAALATLLAPATGLTPHPYRPNDIVPTLQSYVRAGQTERIPPYLESLLPAEWPVRAMLAQAARDVLALEQATTIAASAGASTAETAYIREEAEQAAEALWQTADRLAAVAAQGILSERLQQQLAQQEARLTDLITALRPTRERLAEYTLTGGDTADLEIAEVRLRALGEATRALL